MSFSLRLPVVRTGAIRRLYRVASWQVLNSPSGCREAAVWGLCWAGGRVLDAYWTGFVY